MREQQINQDLDSLPSNCSETEDLEQLNIKQLVDHYAVDRLIAPQPSMHHKNRSSKTGQRQFLAKSRDKGILKKESLKKFNQIFGIKACPQCEEEKIDIY